MSGLNKYGNQMTVLINLEGNELDPFVDIDTTIAPKVLAGTKRMAKSYLDRILAVPRLQYLEKYPKFFTGDRSISFKYSLKGKAAKYTGKVEVSESKVGNPFCVLDTEDDDVIYSFKQGVRFNFQKFTKIEVIKHGGEKSNN